MICMNTLTNPIRNPELEPSKQTPVFAVTELIRNFHYLVTDEGSHLTIELSRGNGYAKLVLSRRADVADVADQLIQLLDNADQFSST